MSKTIGYRLTPIREAEPGQLVTHAFMTCSRCGGHISHNNGPGVTALCLGCVDEMNEIEGVYLPTEKEFFGEHKGE